MRKTTDEAREPDRPLFPLDGWGDGETHVPAHHGFRDKYFAGFGKHGDSRASSENPATAEDADLPRKQE